MIETRDDILRQAMVDARDELTSGSAGPGGRGRGAACTGSTCSTRRSRRVRHPGLVEWLFNRGPLRVGGGGAIVDATGVGRRPRATRSTAAPSMRMVVDLADLDRSRWVNLTGVSGHPFYPHYADQVGAWVKGETYAWPFTEKAVRKAEKDELRLVPDRSDA